jgi:hypothetical protein
MSLSHYFMLFLVCLFINRLLGISGVSPSCSLATIDCRQLPTIYQFSFISPRPPFACFEPRHSSSP